MVGDIAALGGWLVWLPLAALALARIFAHDRLEVLVWLNAYTFWIYMPAYAVAVLAALLRRWMLLGAAGLVIASHLFWVLPDYAGAEPITEADRRAPSIRLVSANVKFDNPDLDTLMEELRAEDPDILFIQEYTDDVRAAIERAGLAEAMPHQVGTGDLIPLGTAIYSKLPLADGEIWYVDGNPMSRATVRVGSRDVRLYNLHPTSPTDRYAISLWNNQWPDILRELEAEEGPLIAAGDFNLTQHHRWYQKLLEGPLHGCYEDRGRGNATTWPNGAQGLLPEIRIDHVVLSPGLTCLAIREGKGTGSDHRPMIADIAVLQD